MPLQLLEKNPQMQDILINNEKITTNNAAIVLDFGAFAKGVAIEKMMSILKDQHIDNALINAGGDLKVLGSKNGKAWKIGIKNPAKTQNPSEKAIIAAIDTSSRFILTSLLLSFFLFVIHCIQVL